MEKEKAEKERENEKREISMEFLASISHEIRNPLNIIIGLTHLLKSAESEEEKERYIKELDKTSQSTLELVNNIMDFSKVRDGKLNYEYKSVNLKASLEENLVGLKTMSEAKGLDLFVEVSNYFPSSVYTDPVKINQVLLNLVSNALKFTEKGHVKLIVEIEETFDSAVRVKFEVGDTGNGIPEEKLERIFNAFDQGSEEINLKFGGTGLGLSICKKVISKLGGELQVESVIGVGTRFFFSLVLPIRKIDVLMGSEKIQLQSNSNHASQTILVVDDSEINTLVIKRTLEKHNFRIIVANDGLSAIKILQEKIVDLVLIDIHMPGMDGMEAAGIIKNLPELNYLPIIAVTGSTDISYLKNIKTSPFSDFILKPFHPEKLALKISSVLS